MAASTLFLSCAGGPALLQRKDLENPKPAESYRVTTTDGQVLFFISLHLEGDWLAGTTRLTSEETEGEGETQRTNITNRYQEVRIPWAEVRSVEALGLKRGGSSVFLAGGALILGVAAFLVLSSTGGSDTSDGGKGF